MPRSERRSAATETDFRVVVHVEPPTAPPTILHGVIDLAFRTADGWPLIDYKTDQTDLPRDSHRAMALKYVPTQRIGVR